jgi:hypothetical protein
MSIMLARLPLSFAEIRAAVMGLDTLRIDENMCKGFLDFQPTKEEVCCMSLRVCGMSQVSALYASESVLYESSEVCCIVASILTNGKRANETVLRRSMPLRTTWPASQKAGRSAKQRASSWRYGQL